MSKIIRIAGWAKRKDPKKGKKLQILANRMFMAGDTGTKYRKIRAAAEYHLGFWDWETKGPKFGQSPVKPHRSDPKAIFPAKCREVKCTRLPAGSAACMSSLHECP